MERMIIKHLSGSKANQVEEFALKHHNELIFGRETTSTVKYDPDRDDLVGRQHAKIQKDPNNTNGFIINDLSSRNGTFVNNVKISGPTVITPGDVVQFGPDGPKFQFDVEPRPMNATKPTRVAETAKTAPETRVTPSQAAAPMNVQFGGNDSVPTQVAPPKSGIGKATVERMISERVEETKQQEGRKFAAVGGAAAFIGLLLIGSLAFGGYYYNSRIQQKTQEQIEAQNNEIAAKDKEREERDKVAREQAEKDKQNFINNANPAQTAVTITEKFKKSVVYITGSWQLTNKASKSQIYHKFIPNTCVYISSKYGVTCVSKGPLIPGGPAAIPLYVQVGNKYEPVLTDDKDSGYPIGGNYSGSGFIVSSDGFIMTNRHIAKPFRAQHMFPQNYPQGILITENGQLQAGVDPPSDWIPEHTKAVGRQFQGQFEDVLKLEVMLPGNEIPIQAEFNSVSPRADVGLIKIQAMGDLPKVEILDDFDGLKQGEGLVIMGYPASAPVTYKLNFSKDMLNQESRTTIIPNPTVSTSSIGNLTKSEMKDLENIRMSDHGDTIRYAVSLTGSGNSGGPVFNMDGKVIGIHFAGDGKQAGFAVPIRYGMQLVPNYKEKSGS